MVVVINILLTTIGCTLIGSEYSAALGWGVWLILISRN